MANVAGIGNYYLQIQALTPVQETRAEVAVEPLEKSPKLPFGVGALIVFVIVFLLGLITISAAHARTLRQVMMVFITALTIAAVPLGLDLVSRPTQVPIRAGPELVPTVIRVQDVNQTGFTIRWNTEAAGMGAVRVGTDPAGKIFRWTYPEEGNEKLSAHLITIKNLKPNQTYYIEILSHTTWYNDNGKPIVIKTLP